MSAYAQLANKSESYRVYNQKVANSPAEQKHWRRSWFPTLRTPEDIVMAALATVPPLVAFEP